MNQKLNTGRLTGSFVLERISFSIPSNSIMFSMSSCSFMCTSLSLCSVCSGSLSKFEKVNVIGLLGWLHPNAHTCIYCWPYRFWIYSLDTLCGMGNTLPVLVCLHRSPARSHTPPAYEQNLIWWHWIGLIQMIYKNFIHGIFFPRWRLTWKITLRFHRTILSDSMISSNEPRTWHAANMLCHPCRMLSADLPQFHKGWHVLHREMHAFVFPVMSAASVSILSNIHRPSIGFVSIADIRRRSQLWK